MAASTPHFSSSSEDMQVLLIGAARAPDATKGHEKEFRMFNSVKNDLQRMYDKSYALDVSKGKTAEDSRGYLNVLRCLVSHKELAPKQRPFEERFEREKKKYKVTHYRSMSDIQSGIKDFVTEQDGPNLLIYFSGHGSYKDAPDSSRDKAASAAAEEEALTIPVHRWNSKTEKLDTEFTSYSASKLTADINEAIKIRADGQKTSDVKIYIVIDACHAGGLLNMWQLDVNVRRNDFVVLFAGAETELDADYDNNGGKFTAEFVKHFQKGKALYTLAQDILDKLYVPNKRSPCVRYSRPDLCYERLLQTSTK